MDVSRQDPRANQKERTRTAIVDAAHALMRDGTRPTVQAAAEAAKVSRATAYRYFPTQEALVTEVMSVSPATAMVDPMLEGLTTDDPKKRLLALLDLCNPLLLQDEARYRAALRIYLDTWFQARADGAADQDRTPRVRAGRRMRWLDEALSPLRDRLSEAAWGRLQCALALTTGIDSMVVLRDVCGIENDEELLDVLRWTALAILDAAKREIDVPHAEDVR